MTPTRILCIITLIALTSCASIRDYSTLALYQAQGKVLLVVASPCAPGAPGKPALVMQWVRERDIGKMTVACDAECNCKLVKLVKVRARSNR